MIGFGLLLDKFERTTNSKGELASELCYTGGYTQLGQNISHVKPLRQSSMSTAQCIMSNFKEECQKYVYIVVNVISPGWMTSNRSGRP